MKDFVDDVNISDQPLPELLNLSADLKEVLLTEPPKAYVSLFLQAYLFVTIVIFLTF